MKSGEGEEGGHMESRQGTGSRCEDPTASLCYEIVMTHHSHPSWGSFLFTWFLSFNVACPLPPLLLAATEKGK